MLHEYDRDIPVRPRMFVFSCKLGSGGSGVMVVVARTLSRGVRQRTPPRTPTRSVNLLDFISFELCSCQVWRLKSSFPLSIHTVRSTALAARATAPQRSFKPQPHRPPRGEEKQKGHKSKPKSQKIRHPPRPLNNLRTLNESLHLLF